MIRPCVKRKNPWLREVAGSYENDNGFPDLFVKQATLKVSSSVVALSSYTTDSKKLRKCSGVIIGNEGNNGYIVITSANLIRRRRPREQVRDNSLADNLKVIIHPCNGESYHGELCTFDFHYNLAWIRFRSHSSHYTAELSDLNDFISINPADEEKDKSLNPHSNIVPGDTIVSVGRRCKSFHLMTAPGEFILARCDLDCKELFMGTCNITKCYEGGPIVNITGEVIGITVYFNNGSPTPFLPINIALRGWENYKTYGEFRRPSLGFEATNLYATSLSIIEKIIQKFPSICNGVVVEKVISGSSADFAGLQSNDVIVRCGGKTIHSFLEFLNQILKTKAGDELRLSVVRVDQNDLIHLRTVVKEVAAEKFNSWPRNF